MESDLGKRIAVVGGGGKTTHSRALAQSFNLAFIELDAIHWKPGWVEREAAEFQALSGTALDRATGGWVTDGNYFTKLGDPVIRRADTVNWVNIPWRMMFWRTWRSIASLRVKRQVCGENVESWRLLFFTTGDVAIGSFSTWSPGRCSSSFGSRANSGVSTGFMNWRGAEASVRRDIAG